MKYNYYYTSILNGKTIKVKNKKQLYKRLKKEYKKYFKIKFEDIKAEYKKTIKEIKIF